MTTYTREEAATQLQISNSTFTQFVIAYRSLYPDYQPSYVGRGRQMFDQNLVDLLGKSVRRCAASPRVTRVQAIQEVMGGHPTDDSRLLDVPTRLSRIEAQLSQVLALPEGESFGQLIQEMRQLTRELREQLDTDSESNTLLKEIAADVRSLKQPAKTRR